jgi:predicted XRE-type DNA-binding protein
MAAFTEKPANSHCWAWTGSKNKQGYGKIKFLGADWMAHRLSYELRKGPTPKNMMVCHSCDNPECTNPQHLFLGSALENMQDKMAKGRHRGAKSGAKHHKSKLKGDDVIAIRQIYARKDMNQRQLGVLFGVCQSEISQIVTFKKWKELT